MNLLEEYKRRDVVGFSFSPIDYIEEKIMCDEPEFKSIDAPRSEGDYVLSWEGETIVGDLGYVFTYLQCNNFHIHACNKDGVIVNLEIHDFETIWYESISPVTANQYKESE
tara:strand:+ start:34985 stop:35317 length:333 start_codon:yes stop_codon:yes gene_type:complete